MRKARLLRLPRWIRWFEPPSVMKVDVEGAEAKVFHGGAGLIAQHKPMIIFENYRPFNELEGVLEPMVYLASLGYVFYRLAWARKTKKISFYMGDDGDPTPQSSETLALAEFEPAERLLLADGLNIFACHREQGGRDGSTIPKSVSVESVAR